MKNGYGNSKFSGSPARIMGVDLDHDEQERVLHAGAKATQAIYTGVAVAAGVVLGGIILNTLFCSRSSSSSSVTTKQPTAPTYDPSPNSIPLYIDPEWASIGLIASIITTGRSFFGICTTLQINIKTEGQLLTIPTDRINRIYYDNPSTQNILSCDNANICLIDGSSYRKVEILTRELHFCTLAGEQTVAVQTDDFYAFHTTRIRGIAPKEIQNLGQKLKKAVDANYDQLIDALGTDGFETIFGCRPYPNKKPSSNHPIVMAALPVYVPDFNNHQDWSHPENDEGKDGYLEIKAFGYEEKTLLELPRQTKISFQTTSEHKDLHGNILGWPSFLTGIRIGSSSEAAIQLPNQKELVLGMLKCSPSGDGVHLHIKNGSFGDTQANDYTYLEAGKTYHLGPYMLTWIPPKGHT